MAEAMINTRIEVELAEDHGDTYWQSFTLYSDDAAEGRDRSGSVQLEYRKSGPLPFPQLVYGKRYQIALIPVGDFIPKDDT